MADPGESMNEYQRTAYETPLGEEAAPGSTDTSVFSHGEMHDRVPVRVMLTVNIGEGEVR